MAVEGDSAEARAFEAMFAAHRWDLTRFAARRVGRDAAADVVSEVFLIAWRRRDAYRAEDARLWLFGVARHVIANSDRAERRRARLDERAELSAADGSAVVPDLADLAAVQAQVRALLAALPWPEQEALRLTEWDQLDHGEAATVAGCSRATFRVRLHRARRHFARLLAASEAEATDQPRTDGIERTEATRRQPSLSRTATGKDDSL